MANEVRIRVTGRDDSGDALGGARRGMQNAARAAEQMQRAADRAAASLLASRRATLAATEATERAERSARAAAEAQERLARGEISEAEAARFAAQAQRDLERAQIAQMAASQRATEAERRQAEHQRMLAESAREAAEEQERARRESDRSGESAGRLSRMLSSAGDGFMAMGRSANESAMSITGKGGPVAAWATLGAALTAAPIIATAAGTAITLGFGGALAGLGMKAAASSVEVQSAFGAMKERVVSEFQEISTPWESTLLQMSKIGESTFDGLSDSLRAAFTRMAPQVTEFMFDVGDALGEFEPMIDRLSVAFGPLLATLGDRLPDIVGTLADAFTKIGEEADPRALDMIIDAFNGLVTATAEVIVFFERMGSVMALSWDGIKQIGDGIKDLFTGADTAGDAEEIGKAIGGVGGTALKAASGVARLRDELEQLAGKKLSAREAARAFQEAIDDASASVKEHGRTLDIGTEAGRANQAALDNIAKSALVYKTALEEAGYSTGDAMGEARAQFLKAAKAMGATDESARGAADAFGLLRGSVEEVPGQKRISVKDNAKVREQAFKFLAGAVRAVPPGKRVTVRDNASTVTQSVNILSGAIRGIPSGKRVTVSFRTVGESALRGALDLLNSLPGSVGGYAHGGIVGATPAAGGGPRSNWVLVGEQGPELVKVAPGSTVVPAGQTATMLGRNKKPKISYGIDDGFQSGPPRIGTAGPGWYTRDMPTRLEIRSGGSGLDDLLVELLRKAIRVRGGDVQVVLGR